MSSARTRTQVWADNLGDWTWPGQGGGAAAAAEMLPPAWVPAFPPRHESAPSAPAADRGSGRARRLLIAGLLTCLAAVCTALALNGQLTAERILGLAHSHPPAATTIAVADRTPVLPLPTFVPYSHNSSGSVVESTSYRSVALHGTGSFYVYLPAGYAATSSRYPVLYLLHGNSQPATAFLELGLQEELDRLIAGHVIPPMIAVMIQGGPGSNNWRNLGAMRYESYVLEVQEMVDRSLPSIASRASRAIAGDSMGGYGAMNVALGNPYRFGVVESWLGFFNGLGGELRADRPIIKALGLNAFVYGGESDKIADPTENRPFAAALRAAGAHARAAVYPGDHSVETLQAHLASMLTFAGRSLAKPSAHAPH
jgi:enterochelin esterase-like enzyme